MTIMATSIQRTLWHVVILLGVFAVAANAQDRCGTLADALKFGADEDEVTAMRTEARQLHRFACGEQSETTNERTATSVNASYNLFSAGANNNSSSIRDYREKHCSLREDDVASIVANSFRQRRVNPEVVRAWSTCISDQTGLSLDPRLDANQKIASFSITYDDRRFSTNPILRGISSPIFECEEAGTGKDIGVGGEPIGLSSTEALVIRCDRVPEPGDIGGRPITVYRDDALILDLTTGQYRIDFAARREGPAVDEFVQLQEEVTALRARAEALEGEERSQSGVVGLPYSTGVRPLARRVGETMQRGTVEGRVDFPMAFARVPVVHMALTQADIRRGANVRLRVGITSVDQEGFEYELYSWSDTHVYSASASWIAVVP